MDLCLARAEMLHRSNDLLQRSIPRVLEPSAGDGAFLRGLLRSTSLRAGEVLAVEPDPEAREGARPAAEALGARLIGESFLAWVGSGPEPVDLLVGNPPFVRYQRVAPEERDRVERLLPGLPGVANLWLPFVLLGLRILRPGGAFALVLPEELLSTRSAGRVRAALLAEAEDLSLDLLPRGAFPELLQDVVVASGRKRAAPHAGPASLTLREGGRRWTHRPPPGEAAWTRWLLDGPPLAALDAACALPRVRSLGELAHLQVSTVTGANAFFTLDDEGLARWGLAPWARPLLPRARHAPGLDLGPEDHAALRAAGAAGWLIDLREPPEAPGPRAWLAEGEAAGLHLRTKCRARKPWHALPVVPPGALVLSKRAHHHHRLLLNRARLTTTDTLYQGRLREGVALPPEALVAGFHGSLTRLCMELEGRSYGGGVLELVPSEVARLRVPSLPALAEALPELDALVRAGGWPARDPEALTRATDALLARALPGYAELAPALAAGHAALRARRQRDALA